jgi:hypothetical protein
MTPCALTVKAAEIVEKTAMVWSAYSTNIFRQRG